MRAPNTVLLPLAAGLLALLELVAACADPVSSAKSAAGGQSLVTLVSTATAPAASGQPPSAVASATAQSGSGSAVAGSGSAGVGRTVGATATQASPPASPPSTRGGTIYLTSSDSGRTISVRTGTRIELTLQPHGGSYDPPSVANPAVLTELSHHGGYPSNTSAVADFRAQERGNAEISSQTDLACLHTTPACLPPQFEFRVTISVR